MSGGEACDARRSVMPSDIQGCQRIQLSRSTVLGSAVQRAARTSVDRRKRVATRIVGERLLS
jgi:hypothetical protein